LNKIGATKNRYFKIDIKAHFGIGDYKTEKTIFIVVETTIILQSLYLDGYF